MERLVGTVSRGIRAPIVRQGDDIAQIVVDSVLNAAESEGFSLRDRDVVAVTEADGGPGPGQLCHRTQQIASGYPGEISAGGTPGGDLPHPEPEPVSPSACRGIAQGAKKIALMLSLSLQMKWETIWWIWMHWTRKGINPWTDVLTEDRNTGICSATSSHTFTGVDYVEYYTEPDSGADGAEVEVIFSNDRRHHSAPHRRMCCACDIHTRARTKRLLQSGRGQDRAMAWTKF